MLIVEGCAVGLLVDCKASRNRWVLSLLSLIVQDIHKKIIAKIFINK